MEIWHGLESIPHDLGATVVTIGVFDGIHRGHQQLIAAARMHADRLGVPCVVITFNPHPVSVIRPELTPPQLATFERRMQLIEQLGVDAVVALRFDVELAAQSPEEFFTEILLDKLHIKAVAVGENFTFGHKAAGTTATLRELGEQYDVLVDIVDLLTEEGQTLSSTRVRGLLMEGDVVTAAEVLGRNYAVTGVVSRGAGRGGKELGYPTANLYLPDSVALPSDGVYCGWFSILDEGDVDGDMEVGVKYPTAVSIGTNPTFGDHRRSVEAFVLDQDADLYDRHCRVEFVDRLRGMEKFTSVEQLLEAMARDVAKTRTILGLTSN